MKKKIGIIIIILLLLSVVGTILLRKPEEKDKEMNNPSFGQYNGIYEYKNYKFKVLQKEKMIYFQVYNKKDLYGINSGSLEGSKAEIDEYQLEFQKNKLKVKSSTKNIPSGEYKKTSGYSTDEIYTDYIGEISLYENPINGKYENNNLTIYIVQTTKDTIKLSYETEEEQTNIMIEKKEENHYSTDFFGTLYDLKFKEKELVLNIKDENGKEKEESGTYQKTGTLTKEEIINQFQD